MHVQHVVLSTIYSPLQSTKPDTIDLLSSLQQRRPDFDPAPFPFRDFKIYTAQGRNRVAQSLFHLSNNFSRWLYAGLKNMNELSVRPGNKIVILDISCDRQGATATPPTISKRLSTPILQTKVSEKINLSHSCCTTQYRCFTEE
ncbi:hypothetical protein ACGC1H_002946 [Rhizoctonia solani]